MHRYYSVCIPINNIISLTYRPLSPYLFFSFSGLMITITLPCFHKGNFIGVVGTDIHVEDLLSDITFFNQGQSTYAFVVSNSGRTLIHPLLPIPTDAYGDPFFIDIRTLETEAEFIDVFVSIKELVRISIMQCTRLKLSLNSSILRKVHFYSF